MPTLLSRPTHSWTKLPRLWLKNQTNPRLQVVNASDLNSTIPFSQQCKLLACARTTGIGYSRKTIDVHPPQEYDAATQALLACQPKPALHLSRPRYRFHRPSSAMVVFHMNSRVN